MLHELGIRIKSCIKGTQNKHFSASKMTYGDENILIISKEKETPSHSLFTTNASPFLFSVIGIQFSAQHFLLLDLML